MTIALYDLVGSDPARPFSPHCWKTRMALAHKGLAFESLPVRFVEVASIEGGTDRTVPVIRDGEAIVQDSFAIAEYLDDTYPDGPALFGSPGGRGLARFMENWTQRTIHPFVASVAILDIHDMLDDENRAFFRQSREKRSGKSLEAIQDGRTEEGLAIFQKSLDSMRATLKRQPFISGDAPMFADYIVFGAFQWLRVASTVEVLASDDPVRDWFERCLDLHKSLGRSVPAASA